MPTLRSASRVTQVAPLQLLELEHLALVVVDNVDGILTTPDLEVCNGP